MRDTLLTLVTLTPLALACTAAAQHWTENGDAGAFPAGCGQPAAGSGPLLTIAGATDTGQDDFLDAYVIEVTDPAAFYATTNGALDPAASAAWDTRLFLFDSAAGPRLANDDSPNNAGAQSFLSDPGIFPGTVHPTAQPLVAGTYVLVVTGWANDPRDAGGMVLFDLDHNLDGLLGPDPAAGPFDHWENFHGLVQSGAYVVALQGAGFVTTPGCAADLNGDGVVNVLDLLDLLAAWSPTTPGAREDINCDGAVNVLDLLELLTSWGPC